MRKSCWLLLAMGLEICALGCGSGVIDPGVTTPDCNNSCSPEGSTRCADGTVSTCVADGQGCLAWNTPAACPFETCQDQNRCADCVPDCRGRKCGKDAACGTDDCGSCSEPTPICSPEGQCEAGESDPVILEIVSGDDWRLPATSVLTPNSGYYTWSPDWNVQRNKLPRFQDGNVHFARCAFVSWKELNPAEGTYDWQRIDGLLSSNPGVWFWIPNYRREYIPDWVVAKGNLKFATDGTAASWDPNGRYQDYYGRMLKALGQRYSDDPRLVAVYMLGLDADWGEFQFPADTASDRLATLKAAEAETGLSPESLRAWGLKFVADHLEAFPGQQQKLVWVNHSSSFVHAPGQDATRRAAYNAAAADVVKLVRENGLGGRDGGTDVGGWNNYRNATYGMSMTKDGYLEYDEVSHPIPDGAVSGTENENYYSGVSWFGPHWRDAEAYRINWLVTCMRGLQMRRNWMMINHDEFPYLEATGPEFTEWVERSLGKTPKTSPDAWSWLREGYPAGGTAFKNFERWLLQRDVAPDGVTMPADKVDHPVLAYFHERSPWLLAQEYEFHARRTDRANGSSSIYFKTERLFLQGGPHNLLLKVAFLDGAVADWHVEYTGQNGESHSPPVSTTSSGAWKTVTFKIPDMRFDGAFQGQMDFRITTTGPGDATIKLVRLVKP